MSVNVLADLPKNLPKELTTVLQEGTGIRIERIVSHGQSSPPSFWYDQPQNERVMVLTGAASSSLKTGWWSCSPRTSSTSRPIRSTA